MIDFTVFCVISMHMFFPTIKDSGVLNSIGNGELWLVTGSLY